MELTLYDLEHAINYWRKHKPSTGEEKTLSPEVNTLARLYALMIFRRITKLVPADIDSTSNELINHWRTQQD